MKQEKNEKQNEKNEKIIPWSGLIVHHNHHDSKEPDWQHRPGVFSLFNLLCKTVRFGPRRPRPTATRDPQCSLPDLNHDHPRPVFPAGPQPRPATPSVPCRTSTTTIHAQCSLPDLNREYPRQVFPAGPHVGR